MQLTIISSKTRSLNGIISSCKLYHVPSNFLYRYGESLGSGPTVYLASQQSTPVGGIILHSIMKSGHDIFLYGLKKIHNDKIFPNIDLIKFVNTHVFIMHGNKDEIIPIINA